jgi:hypothetical protein
MANSLTRLNLATIRGQYGYTTTAFTAVVSLQMALPGVITQLTRGFSLGNDYPGADEILPFASNLKSVDGMKVRPRCFDSCGHLDEELSLWQNRACRAPGTAHTATLRYVTPE